MTIIGECGPPVLCLNCGVSLFCFHFPLPEEDRSEQRNLRCFVAVWVVLNHDRLKGRLLLINSSYQKVFLFLLFKVSRVNTLGNA